MSIIIKKIKKNVKLEIKSFLWRKKNRHNFTVVGDRFPKDNSIVNVGRYTYGQLKYLHMLFMLVIRSLNTDLKRKLSTSY